MSYRTEIQDNNTDLQGLIDQANALPDYENLDSELSEQDNLIGQIMTALEGKSAISGGKSTISVELNFDSGAGTTFVYFDSDGNPQTITVEQFSTLDVDLSKYLVKDGEIIEDPNWESYGLR